jgi:hypothetical protein
MYPQAETAHGRAQTAWNQIASDTKLRAAKF